jgi:hypothetical protein
VLRHQAPMLQAQPHSYPLCHHPLARVMGPQALLGPRVAGGPTLPLGVGAWAGSRPLVGAPQALVRARGCTQVVVVVAGVVRLWRLLKQQQLCRQHHCRRRRPALTSSTRHHPRAQRLHKGLVGARHTALAGLGSRVAVVGAAVGQRVAGAAVVVVMVVEVALALALVVAGCSAAGAHDDAGSEPGCHMSRFGSRVHVFRSCDGHSRHGRCVVAGLLHCLREEGGGCLVSCPNSAIVMGTAVPRAAGPR